ncbi:hypothetical protein HHK36_007032 [Tetracentron sinense]|uniref:RING-type domain-containing protein n=1 Tax=Tetracentron sinense TaxID=13715 RepID=A0A834ZI82_TETSI|nr:hypothetical protein HHK36_007032 [Tetracentron sinense]
MGSSYSLLTITHFKLACNLLFHQSLANSFDRELPKNGEEVGIRRFKCKPELVQEVECAVCLCRIEEEEEIRELRCDHIFHRVCLDRWLGYRHTTCPLCRGSSAPRRMAANLGEEDEPVLLFSHFCSSDIARERSKWWLRVGKLTEVLVEHSEIPAVNACPRNQRRVEAVGMDTSNPAKMTGNEKILRLSTTTFTTNR